MFLAVCTSCNLHEKKFESIQGKLQIFVTLIGTKWSFKTTSNAQKYPYIIIEKSNLQKVTPYFLDKKKYLSVDENLNNILKELLEEMEIKQIKFYSHNYIEFVVYKNTNLIKQKTHSYLYCVNDSIVFPLEPLDIAGWYYKTTSTSW